MVVGIDVAKAELVVAARPSGERWTVTNDERGVRTVVERLRRDAPDLIVLEATDGYELLCVAALAAAALPVCKYIQFPRVMNRQIPAGEGC